MYYAQQYPQQHPTRHSKMHPMYWACVRTNTTWWHGFQELFIRNQMPMQEYVFSFYLRYCLLAADVLSCFIIQVWTSYMWTYLNQSISTDVFLATAEVIEHRWHSYVGFSFWHTASEANTASAPRWPEPTLVVREVHESGGSPLAESSAMQLGEATQLPLAAGALVGAVSGDTSTMDNYGELMITMGF